MKRFFPLLALSLLSCNEGLNHAVTDFQWLTPRQFAYSIGDEMVHHIQVNTHHGVVLNKASLPMQGVKNRWLNINEVKVQDTVTGNTHHYDIMLRYQVFYAPQTVKQLQIPSFTLSFNQGSQHIEQIVPAWQFTLSPLHELDVRTSTLRPNQPPPLLTAPYTLKLLLMSGAVFLGSGLYLAHLHGYLRLPKQKIFTRAKQQLAKTSEHNLAQGLTILHQALNQVYGKPLFIQHLPVFYREHPAYQAADSLLTEFFQASNRYFFTATPLDNAKAWQTLTRCCQICADIELAL